MAVDPSALPTDSLGPVQTDTSGMDATAALNTPAWGPNSPGASAEPPPLPEAPDFARIIPISVVEQGERDAQADAWAAQQRVRLADLWESVAKDHISNQVQQTIDAQQAIHAASENGTINLSGGQAGGLGVQDSGLATNLSTMVAPNTGMSVEPVLSDTALSPGGDVAPGVSAPGRTSGQPAQPVTSENFGQQLADLLRQVVSTTPGTPPQQPQPGQSAKQPTPEDVIRNAAVRAGVPPIPDITGQESPEEYAQKLAAAAQNANYATPGGIFNPNSVPKDLLGNPSLPGEEGAAVAAKAAEEAAAGGETANPIDQLAAKYTPPVEAPATPPLAPETLASVPEDVQPHMQAAAWQLGMDDGQVTKSLGILNDPSQLRRIVSTKNAPRDLTPAQNDARAFYKATQNNLIAANASAGQPVEQTVKQAAQLANPDPQLDALLSQSIEQAGGKQVEPRQPVWAGITETPLPADTAPAEAGAPAATETPATLPSGRTAGPQPLPPPAPGPGADRTPLWLVDKTSTNTSDSLIRDAAREAIGAEPPSEPPSVLPSGRSPSGAGGSQTLPLTAAALHSALELGSFGAGAVYGWNNSDSDSLSSHITSALIRGGEAATAAFVLGGAPSKLGSRFLDAYIGGLISPKVAALKGVQDAYETLIGGPAINLMRGTLEATFGGQGAAHFVDSAKESAAMYANLIGTAAGWRSGLRAASDILTGNAPMLHNLLGPSLTDEVRAAEDALLQAKAMPFGSARTSAVKDAQAALQTATERAQIPVGNGNAIVRSLLSPGKTAVQSGPRAIAAVTAFFQHVMYHQEMAVEALRAASPGRFAAEGYHAGAFTPEAMAARAFARTQQRLYMGEPSGAVGGAALKLLQGMQKAPLFGGRFAVPFARIPTNFLDRTISGIPVLGLANLAGAADPMDVAARQALGVLAGATAFGAYQLFGDRIHGGGPPDPAMAKSLRDNEGFLPYSVTDPQSGQQVAIAKMPAQLKSALLMLGALNDVQRYGANPDKAGAYAKEFGYALGATDLIPNIVNWLENGITASQAANQVAGLAAPWYGRQAAQASRSYAVDTKGTANLPAGATSLQKVEAGAQAGAQESGLPGAGQPPAKIQPATGEPVPNQTQGAKAFAMPFATSQLRPNPVADAFGKAGVAIPPAPAKLAVNGHEVELTGQQTQQYEQARGQWLAQHVPTDKPLSADAATAYLKAADEAATATVLPRVDVGRQAQPAKAAKAQQAATSGAFWKAATSSQPASSPSSSPTPPPAAPNATPRNEAFWKRGKAA